MNTFRLEKKPIPILQVLFVLLFQNICINSSFAQTDTIKTQEINNWRIDGTFLFHIHEATFTNWASGGDNQLASKVILKPVFNYDNGKWSWENTFDFRYGQQRNAGEGLKKNEHEIAFISKVGKRFSEKWKFSGMYTFNSQFAPFWDGTVLKSDFMSPAYTNLSLGFDYVPNTKLSIYVTPLNMRNTWVFNDSISARGDYNMEPGNYLRFRFGPSFLLTYKGDIAKNIKLDTKLGYFQDLIDGIGDPVVNWDALFNMKVNKFISASFNFTLFYDEDSKTDIKDESGNVIGQEAKVQFKQSLGVGLSYTW